MNTYLIAKMCKHIATAWFVGASIGSLQHEDSRQRRRWAYYAAIPGFLALWWSGYVVLRMSGYSMREPWVLVSSLGSMLTMWSVLWLAESRDVEVFRRRRIWANVFAALGLLIAYVWMVLKPDFVAGVVSSAGGAT